MTLTDGEKHDLSKHDAVAFEAAEGEEGACLAEDSFPVRRIVHPTCFTIPRTPALGAGFRGGRFRQVRRMERERGGRVFASGCFCVLFGLTLVKLSTMYTPLHR